MTSPIAPVPFKERLYRSPWLVGWLFSAASLVLGGAVLAVALPTQLAAIRSIGSQDEVSTGGSLAMMAVSGLSSLVTLALAIGQIIALVRIWQRASSRGDNIARRNVAGRVNLWLTTMLASILTVPVMFLGIFALIGSMLSGMDGTGRDFGPSAGGALLVAGILGLVVGVFSLLVLIATISCTVAEWRGEARRPFCAIPFWRPRDLVPYYGYAAPPAAPQPGTQPY